MSEPSLSCGPNSAHDIYRFTWLRTFHHPIAVRVTYSDGGPLLEAVELDGAGGYTPGKVIHHISKSLSPEQWKALADAIETAHYWEQPTHDTSDGGLDGAQWIIEARHVQTYHAVDRWSPFSGSYRALGLLFLKLSDLQPESIY